MSGMTLFSMVPGGAFAVAARLEEALIRANDRLQIQATSALPNQSVEEPRQVAASWINELQGANNSVDTKRFAPIAGAAKINVAREIQERGEEAVLIGLYKLVCRLEGAPDDDTAQTWAEASAASLQGAHNLFGEFTFTSVYSLLQQGFKIKPEATRLRLKHPQVTIEVNRTQEDKQEGRVSCISAWLDIHLGRPLTNEEAKAAIALFDNGSNISEIASIYCTATSKHEDSMTLDEALSAYSSEKENLQSILVTPPKTSMSDKILGGPIEVPPHAWKRIYVAFDTSDPDFPEHGSTSNSIVLFRDGIMLTTTKQANLMHAISPQLNALLEGLDVNGINKIDFEKLVGTALKRDTLSSEADVFKRMSTAPQPLMMGNELGALFDFVSQLVGRDVKTLPYKVESWI